MDKVRRTRWVGWLSLGVVGGIALIGWLVLHALPDRYEASAEFVVELRPDLALPLPIEPEACARLIDLRESLLAEGQLLEIAHEASLLPRGGVDPATQERVLASLRQRIWLTVLPPGYCNPGVPYRSTTPYRIVFRDPDRSRALRVVTVAIEALRGQVAPDDALRMEILQAPTVGRISLWTSFARPTHSRQLPDPNTV